MAKLLAEIGPTPDFADDDHFCYWTFSDMQARRIVASRTDLHRKQRFYGFPRPVVLTGGVGAAALYRVSRGQGLACPTRGSRDPKLRTRAQRKQQAEREAEEEPDFGGFAAWIGKAGPQGSAEPARRLDGGELTTFQLKPQNPATVNPKGTSHVQQFQTVRPAQARTVAAGAGVSQQRQPP